MLEKESRQGPFSISPEIAAISYMDANTLIFSNTVPEIAAVSSMNKETAVQRVISCFKRNQNVDYFS